jgi:hypothetical protein
MNLSRVHVVLVLSLSLAACGTTTGGSTGEVGGGGGGGGETGGAGGEGASQPVCPAEEDPTVHYISQDPSTCDQTDCGGSESDCIPCGEGQDYFSDPECGCGCIDRPASNCPDPNDPAVHYLETDPALCGLTDCGEADCIPCSPEQEYFQNECGCGCIDPAT